MSFLYRHVLIPAFERGLKRRRTFAYWRELERSQWRSSRELQNAQLRALRNLLAHAEQHCPYYAGSWREQGLQAAAVQSADDLRRWPLTNSDTVRTHRQAMRASAPAMRLIPKTTGGATGVPLQFDIDEGSYQRRMAAAFRGYNWAGAAPGTKQMYLWGVGLQGHSMRQRVKDGLYQRLYRRRFLNCFELGDQSIGAFRTQLARWRPEVIVAYTGALYALASAFEERGLRPDPPRSIVVGAERLHEFQRTLIERVFSAPVFETYGCREFMLMGAECDRHAGLHLSVEHLVVEIVDDDGRPVADGEEGNVVITDLFNYGMPFIRYMNGDRAIAGWSKCKCGRQLPLLKKVTGRRLDVLVTPDGRRVPGEFFPALLKDFSAIRRYQAVQESPGHVRLRLVVGPAWNESLQGHVEGQSRGILGPEVRFAIDLVDEIPLSASGKLQVVVNRCGNRRLPAPDASTARPEQCESC